MLRRLLYALPLVAALAAGAQTTTITASNLVDISGQPLAAGYLQLTPVGSVGHAIAFEANGKQYSPLAHNWAITNGVAATVTVPDVAGTNPGIGYMVQILDNATPIPYVIASYAQPIFPTGSTWSFDAYQPAQAPITYATGSLVAFGSSVPPHCSGSSTGYVNGPPPVPYYCVGGVYTQGASGGGSGVEADWNATSGGAVILNKPTIPAAQVNSDWNAGSGLAQVLNKPSIPAQCSTVTTDSTHICIGAAPYNASAAGGTATTASATFAVGTSGSVASCSTFLANQGVRVAGAGAAGASYFGKVVSCSGTTLTVTPATSTSVASGAVVQHDETAAFQSAITALTNGGTIYVPDGAYLVNGPLQDTSGANAVLTMPHIQYVSTPVAISISIQGFTLPSATNGTGGAIIQTSAPSGSLIGAFYNVGTYPGFTNVWLDLSNLRFRSYANPGLTIVNGSWVVALHANHIWCDTGASTPDPSNTAGACIRYPTVGNNVSNTGDDLSEVGYYTGFQITEHTHIGAMYAANSHDPFLFDTGTDATFPTYLGNSASVNYLWSQNCHNGVTGGTHPTTVNIQNADVELPIENALSDPNNQLQGVINLLTPYSPQGTLTIVGGANVQLNNLAIPGYKNVVNAFHTQSTVINTTFNEGTSGASIYGTAPATNIPGGTWSNGGTGAATFNGSGATFAGQAAAILQTGTSNGTFTFSSVVIPGGADLYGFAVRLNAANTSGLVLTINTGTGQMLLQDFPLSGGPSTIATASFAPGSLTGSVVFAVSGTSVSVTAFGVNLSGSVSGSSSTLTQTYLRVNGTNGFTTDTIGGINVAGGSSMCSGALLSTGTCATLANVATSGSYTDLSGKPAASLPLTGGTVTGQTSFPAVKSVFESSETVTFSATPTFSNATRASYIVLTGNVASFTLAAGADGQEKTLTFCQDATGSRTVAAPTNVHGFFTVGTTLSKCSSQHFTYYVAQTAWLADTAGVVSQ